MRAGPLSNDTVIELLNQYFVPAFVSNEDYESATGGASAEERKEYRRFFGEFIDKHLSTGTVHVYILGPDGHAVDGLDVSTASQTEKLVELLRRTVSSLHVMAGDPVVAIAPQSTRPTAPPGSLVLHLVSRGQNTGPQGGSWREFPAENWVILNPTQAGAFVAASDAKVGQSWAIDSAAAGALLEYFYPQSEDPSDSPHTILDAQTLGGTLVSIQGNTATARLGGSVRLHRDFYPGKSSLEQMNAKLLGYVEWRTDSRQITRFSLVTVDASRDGKEKFAVGVRIE